MKKIFAYMILQLLYLAGNAQLESSMIKACGSKLFYKKQGSMGPIVVFVSGLGESHETWSRLQDSISKYCITISYDRAGLGKSEFKEQKKRLVDMAGELNAILQKLVPSKTCILVGHSLGAQIIKYFAWQFPQKVTGLVFVDPGFNERKLRDQLPDSIWRKRESALKTYLPQMSEAQLREYRDLNETCRQADAIKVLPRVPTVLLTATKINPNFPGSNVELRVKQTSHEQWLRTMPGALHIKVNSSRHYIQLDEPQLLLEQINKVVRQVQAERK